MKIKLVFGIILLALASFGCALSGSAPTATNPAGVNASPPTAPTGSTGSSDTTAPAGDTTSATASPTLVEQVLPLSPPRQFTYAGVQFNVTSAIISNRSLINPQAIDPTQFNVQLELAAQNNSQYKASIASGQLHLRFSDGTLVEQFVDSIEARSQRTFSLVGPVAATTTWEGATLTLDEPGKEPQVLPLSGAVSPEVYPLALTAGQAGDSTNRYGEAVHYEIRQATLDINGLVSGSYGERAPAGQRFLRLTINVTNVGGQNGISAAADQFRFSSSGVQSDVVYDETGAASINLGANADLTIWFLVPADAQTLTIIAGADGQQPAELTLTVP
ncbi:MAG: hypothetical protein KDE29_23150 [Anaerolineales bacterium]|nr:hypothetical protein [Anaerolineales bacterium]